MNKSCKELKRISRGVLVGNWSSVVLAFFIIQVIISIASYPFQGAMNAYTQQDLVATYTELGMADLVANMTIPEMPTMTELVLSYVAIIIVSLASSILTAGQTNIHLSLLRGEKFDLKKLFTQFKHRPDRYIVATLLLMLISILCCLPMFIGIGALALLAFGFPTNSVSSIALMVGVVAITYIISIILIFYFSMKFGQCTFFLVDNPEKSVIQSFKDSSRVMKGNYKRYLYITFSFIPMLLLGTLTCGIGLLWISPYMLTVQAAFYMDITGEFQRKEEEAKRLEEEMGPVLSE